MIRKKGGFLTFCFSLLPGAGQMYLGFMKRGTSLMSAFFLLIFAAVFLNLSPIMFAMPVIWFFAFFDANNLRGMPDDEFYATEDNYILIPEFAKDGAQVLIKKYRTILAFVLIIVGFSSLWSSMYDILYSIIPDEISYPIYRIGHYFPQLVIGCAIIALGLYLIRGKKKALDNAEKTSLLEDKGGLQ